MDLNKILQFIVALVGVHIVFQIILYIVNFLLILFLYSIGINANYLVFIVNMLLAIGLIVVVGHLGYILIHKSRTGRLIGVGIEISIIVSWLVYIAIKNS